MTPGADLDLVSRTLQVLLARDQRPITYACAGSRESLFYSPQGAAAPTGLLPAFLVTGEAIWTQATGKLFGLEVTTGPETVLGFRVTAIRRGTFSTVMLSLMETIRQISDPDRLVVNDLARIWREAMTGYQLSAAFGAFAKAKP